MSLYPNSIPRCEHIKINGTQCGSPALRRNHFCFFHKRWQQTRIVLNANCARRGRLSQVCSSCCSRRQARLESRFRSGRSLCAGEPVEAEPGFCRRALARPLQVAFGSISTISVMSAVRPLFP